MRRHIIIPHKSPRTLGEHSQGNWYLQPTSTTLPYFNEVGCFPRMVSFKSQFVLMLDISLWPFFAVIQNDPKIHIYIYIEERLRVITIQFLHHGNLHHIYVYTPKYHGNGWKPKPMKLRKVPTFGFQQVMNTYFKEGYQHF